MPGYILHLTSARMLLDLFSADDSLCSDCGMQNDFYVGNLLPDAGSSKPASHFYDPEYLDRMIVWPRPGEFGRKYREQLEDPLYLGYYYHLYIDKAFLQGYLPCVAGYYDRHGNTTEFKGDVSRVRLKKTGESLPLEKYLSEEYYYGDYTRMNTWLCEKFHLPEELSADRDPKIEEADFSGIDKVLLDLKEYRNVPAKAVEDLRVFDLKELLEFLRWAAWRFYKHLT